MTVFALIPLEAIFNEVKKLVEMSFKEDDSNYFELPKNAGFLLNYAGTSKQLTSTLNLATNEDTQEALIIPFNFFWGVGPATMWEWIKNKMEK